MTIKSNSINANSTTPLGVVQGGTGLSSATTNQLVYASAANTLAGLATSGNGVLITSSGGAPSISSTLPATVQGNITATGTVTSGTWESVLQDYTETNTAANSSTAYTINMANGNVFTITLTGTCTLSMSNVPASGCASLTIILVQGSGPYTVTWPTSFIWPGGTAPTLTTTNGHVDVFVAVTTNGGTTFRAFTSGQNFAS